MLLEEMMLLRGILFTKDKPVVHDRVRVFLKEEFDESSSD